MNWATRSTIQRLKIGFKFIELIQIFDESRIMSRLGKTTIECRVHTYSIINFDEFHFLKLLDHGSPFFTKLTHPYTHKCSADAMNANDRNDWSTVVVAVAAVKREKNFTKWMHTWMLCVWDSTRSSLCNRHAVVPLFDLSIKIVGQHSTLHTHAKYWETDVNVYEKTVAPRSFRACRYLRVARVSVCAVCTRIAATDMQTARAKSYRDNRFTFGIFAILIQSSSAVIIVHICMLGNSRARSRSHQWNHRCITYCFASEGNSFTIRHRQKCTYRESCAYMHTSCIGRLLRLWLIRLLVWRRASYAKMVNLPRTSLNARRYRIGRSQIPTGSEIVRVNINVCAQLYCLSHVRRRKRWGVAKWEYQK